MSRFVGTVTDKSFYEAVRRLPTAVLTKAVLIHNTRKPDDSSIALMLQVVKYQTKRFYEDER